VSRRSRKKKSTFIGGQLRCYASLLATAAEPAHNPECATRNREHRQQTNSCDWTGNRGNEASEGCTGQAEQGDRDNRQAATVFIRGHDPHLLIPLA